MTDRRAGGALAALVIGALAAAACGGESARAASSRPADSEPAAPRREAARRSIVVVDSVSVDAPLALPAQLYVERDAVVAARAAGTIDSLFVDLGTRVAPGAPLATVESEDQRIALAQAEAAHDASDRLARRARVLARSGGVTVADSEHLELQLRQAALGLQKARRDLELTRVVAPFAGVVAERRARPRRLVAVGDTLFRVVESGPLLARVRVPEGAAASLRAGQPATVLGVRGAAAAATVVRVAPAVDAASGTREVVLRVAPHGALLAGSGVTVRLGAERRRTLALPRDALGADGYVVVVDDGRSSLRSVMLGADLGGGRVEVVSGLAAGERVARPAP